MGSFGVLWEMQVDHRATDASSVSLSQVTHAAEKHHTAEQTRRSFREVGIKCGPSGLFVSGVRRMWGRRGRR